MKKEDRLPTAKDICGILAEEKRQKKKQDSAVASALHVLASQLGIVYSHCVPEIDARAGCRTTPGSFECAACWERWVMNSAKETAREPYK